MLKFYRSSKQNEPDEWRSVEVVQALHHYVEIRRKGGKHLSKIAYEDLRLRLNSELAQVLAEGLMEDYIDLKLSPGCNSDTEIEPIADGSLMKCNLMNQKSVYKDMGDYSMELVENPELKGTHEIQSNEQAILKNIQNVVRSRQVWAGELLFATPWIIQKAVEKGHSDNWTHAYEEVLENSVPRNAIIISSHTIFEVKEDDEKVRKLKARLVTHVNRDDMKNEIRKDFSNADMIIVRLLIGIALCIGFSFGVAGVKSAFLQSGPILREIFVRPAPEFWKRKGVLWKLTKLPYGIEEAGQHWAKRIKAWMLGPARLERVFGVKELFVKSNGSASIILLVAKVVHDLLVAASKSDIGNFMKSLQLEFEIWKVCIGRKIAFAGYDIEKEENGSTTMSMKSYMNRLYPIELFRAKRSERNHRATDYETKKYCSLAGTLMYLGSAVLPQASSITSRMQQDLGDR